MINLISLPFTPFFFDLYGCKLGDFFLGLVPEVTVPVLVAVQVRAEAEL